MIQWARERGSARLLRDFHYLMLGLWTVAFPIAVVTGLWQSVAFISMLSIYANWATEFGSVQGSRAEVKAEAAIVNGPAQIDAENVEVKG